MTRTNSSTALCAIALMILGSSSSEAGPSLCGITYPEDFPCLPGGTIAPAPAIKLPGMKGMSLLVYPGTAADLSARFIEAVKAKGWHVEVRSVEEPDGTRYRLQISREGRSLGASIYGDGQVTLQITEFADRDEPQ